MGTVVGMLSILLCFWAWRVERRRWVRWLATGVLGAVVLQGVLGGLRVVLVELDLAIVHACFAQTFFCLTALMCVVTSRWWLNARDRSLAPMGNQGRRLIAWGAVCLFVAYAQLVVGATMRHYGAGLAIPDLPLAYGKVLPPTSDAQLAEVNAFRTWTLHEKPVTLAQVWLHMGHRIGAILVSVAVTAASILVLRRHRNERALLWPALLMLALLLVQLTLGVLTVLMKKPADVASAHVAVGALTLVSCFVLTARAARLYARRAPRVSMMVDRVELPETPAAVAA
jgi:cytochrome c oxidase assembly protein subunit 15